MLVPQRKTLNPSAGIINVVHLKDLKIPINPVQQAMMGKFRLEEDGYKEGPLTEEVDQEPSIAQPAGWSAEEGATIGKIHRETESGNESTGVRVGVPEVEYNRRSLAVTQNRVWKRQQGKQWNKQEEKEELVKRVRAHSES